jgi:hypothetical protein
MYERWFGAGLLLVSLLIAGIAGANVKVSYQRQDWAKSEKDNVPVDVKNQVVLVPPFNSSTGWVGFNITFPNEGKTGHVASGALAPYDRDPNPEIVMEAVNETGLDELTFDSFSEAAWSATEIYAGSFLDSTHTYNSFEFGNLDNSSHYILLFRGYKNETQDRPILISIKETWFEPGNLLEFTPWSTSIIATVAFTGSGLIIYDLNSRRKKNRLKHRQRLGKNHKDKK